MSASDAQDALLDPLEFWDRQARRLEWAVPYAEVLDWSNAPFAKWYVGGRLNAAVNCVDRHVEAGHGERVAYHWVGEPADDARTITFFELKDMVCQAANALVELGVRSGDRVVIYMPMIPEAAVAMLACARIGAPHIVVFGGFSAQALADRVRDCDAKVVITADGGYRRGAASALKPAVDEALGVCGGVDHVVVVRRTGQQVEWDPRRDVWWHELVDRQSVSHKPEAFDSEHPLYVMYTSGTTGKPKGILHTTGGYLVGTTYTHWAIFDAKPETDVFWTAADIGWVTGHSYLLYGALANGVTGVMYEGTPDTPDRGRWWEIVERYGVSVLYCAPTAVRTFMKWGAEVPGRYDLSSLRLLGSVGEPINPEAYEWYREHIGANACPIVDTWWQTETGMHMLAPLPGISTGKAGSATAPIPGVSCDVVDAVGNSCVNGDDGYLVITKPWPAMARTIWGDDERFVETYWSRYAKQGWYFSGDGARRDADGDIWVLGRVDDVINVSGHRLSTSEVESALVSHPYVAEAAAVGVSDETTGQAIVAFVVLREVDGAMPPAPSELRGHIAQTIGPIAKPKEIFIVPDLPKTRSGKIMRRLLRDAAEQRDVGDTSALADAAVMAQISSRLDGARQPAQVE